MVGANSNRLFGFARLVGKGKDEMYIRIVVTDELERKAHTRAYYLREVFN